MSERVDLDLPLHTRAASTVRAVTASLAADAGLSIDAIDDLRVGVDEAISVLTDVDDPGDARLLVRFESDPDEIRVISRRTGGADAVTMSDLDALATRILEAVVDDHTVDEGTITVVKRVDERG